ncbi:MAG: GH92 family glycosyl hydrolase [Bdellovibrionales bacterium]|nr:GH92 family glycosyl hydrolase [Bdellovibrionales bacterium]
MTVGLAFFFLTGFYGCLEDNVGRPLTGGENVGSDDHLIGYVDTRAGTGGLLWASGHTTPAAMVPFGTVKLGPDTSTFNEITSSSGYHYGDIEIRGFSHSRYSGTGLKEGGNFRIMPVEKAISFNEIKNQNMIFRHQSEMAMPGYYMVTLQNKDIKVELTATQHVGVHKYTFNKAANPHLIVDLTSHLSKGGRVEDVSAEVDIANFMVRGKAKLFDDVSTRYGGLDVYFVLKSKRPFTHRFLGSQFGESRESKATTTKEKLFIDLSFSNEKNTVKNGKDATGDPVMIFLAMSYVSLEGATENLQKEVLLKRDPSFGDFRREAEMKWEEILGRIKVEGTDEKLKQIFYSNLYRSFLMPTIVSDESLQSPTQNKYLGFDKKIHEAQNFSYYSDFSLWDTFRTVHPLYNLIAQREQIDMVKSLVAMGEQSGRMPRWSGVAGHGDSMLGLPANIAISESYLKGLEIPQNTALRALELMTRISNPISSVAQPSRIEATNNQAGDGKGRECLAEYTEKGYCPSDAKTNSVSYTLEYSYSDYAISRLAKALNRNDVEAYYAQRSQNYKNTWNSIRFAFVPRASSGVFESSFDLADTSYMKRTKSATHFAEGSANQWRWYVPYDPEGLISLFGPDTNSLPIARKRFADALNEFFLNADEKKGGAYPGPYYWHGNEPNIQAAYLFNAAGRPDLTQKWARWIMDNKYSSDSKALDGDDDAGTLSAWYVLSAIGIFPLAGTDRYMIGSPIFPSISLHVGKSKLNIRVENFAPDNLYVESVSINGQPLRFPWFEHSAIAQGGELVFRMSHDPTPWQGGEKW